MLQLAPEPKGKLSNLICRLDPIKNQKEITYLVSEFAQLNPAFVKFASGLTASDIIEQLQANVDGLNTTQFAKIAQAVSAAIDVANSQSAYSAIAQLDPVDDQKTVQTLMSEMNAVDPSLVRLAHVASGTEQLKQLKDVLEYIPGAQQKQLLAVAEKGEPQIMEKLHATTLAELVNALNPLTNAKAV